MNKIAVIGAGYWGKNLVRNFNELGSLKVICDPSQNVLSTMQEKFPEAVLISDFEKVLKMSEVDAVVISTPAEQHFSMVKKSLEAGKDVFVEKPLSLTTTEGEELVRIAAEQKRILFVGHILHYHPAVVKMKEMISKGVIGRIEYIYSNRLSLGKIRREENILWSFAPHDISLILSLVGEEPTYIDSVGSNFLHPKIADVTMSNFKFPSGVSAHIFVSWLNPFKEQRLVVVGSQGMLVFEDTLPLDKKLTLYPHVINWKNGVPCPEKAEGKSVEITADEPLKQECSAFLQAIENRKQPVTSGEEGVCVLKILQKCQECLEKNREKSTPSLRLENEPTILYKKHSTATVDEGALIGEGTKIWHYSHIMRGAKIGENCSFGQNVNVDGGVKIGDNVKVQNNVSIYTGVEIEDDVFLGPSCVLTNVSNPRSQVNRHSLYENTLIKKGASIGANATIVCGITIGKYAFVGAGSVVTKDIPDYGLVWGNPAEFKGWISRHGHRLENKDEKGIYTCPESGLRYQEDENLNLKCLDLDEDTPMPKELTKGKLSYKDLKYNG